MLRWLAHISELVLSTGSPETNLSESDQNELRSTLNPATLLAAWWPKDCEAQAIQVLREASKYSVIALMMQAGNVYEARADLHNNRHKLLEDVQACLAEYGSRKRRQVFQGSEEATFLNEIRGWLLALPLELFPELTEEDLRLLSITHEEADRRLKPYHELLESIGGYLPDAHMPAWA